MRSGEGTAVGEGTATPEERIADAVLELLRRKGPKAVTIEAVAAHTGMARTTIYRRYRDRDEMLTAVMEPIAQPSPPDPDATAHEVLMWLAEQSLRSVDGGVGFGGLAALVTDADPAFTGLIRSVLVRHRSTLTEVVRHHISRGIVRADLDVETFLDCIVGAYCAERARSGDIDADWNERVALTLLPAFVQP
ncbi:TetR/AcrR family transcriptional regulator [Rhodococcus ruber]|uniref:TetR/AcrR family transcriptional regulator n=1 Tax=Rhodococcus TaxID=1827 RepID=UPI00200E394F|nr:MULTISPECIES: TetR/AcrR family transcriptional regulator [Rhodococcus]UQB73392.1 TetR/AcrR family transcriptional regulator [Rhodococcus ruber]WML63328.1 TetR/AcrR family transcriptional regulator [Rhodococcus sp. AH-ZY2]